MNLVEVWRRKEGIFQIQNEWAWRKR